MEEKYFENLTIFKCFDARIEIKVRADTEKDFRNLDEASRKAIRSVLEQFVQNDERKN